MSNPFIGLPVTSLVAILGMAEGGNVVLIQEAIKLATAGASAPAAPAPSAPSASAPAATPPVVTTKAQRKAAKAASAVAASVSAPAVVKGWSEDQSKSAFKALRAALKNNPAATDSMMGELSAESKRLTELRDEAFGKAFKAEVAKLPKYPNRGTKAWETCVAAGQTAADAVVKQEKTYRGFRPVLSPEFFQKLVLKHAALNNVTL